MRPEANRENFFTKKIWEFWQDQDLVMIYQKNTFYEQKEFKKLIKLI